MAIVIEIEIYDVNGRALGRAETSSNHDPVDIKIFRTGEIGGIRYAIHELDVEVEGGIGDQLGHKVNKGSRITVAPSKGVYLKVASVDE